MRNRTVYIRILVCFLVGSLSGITAAAEKSWQSTAYSMAAGQIGLSNFYLVGDDVSWRRSDDGRFASFKDMEAPAEAADWWVKTFYRSDVFPNYGDASLSQDYSVTQIGYESPHVIPRWGGKLYEGAFYTMSTSNAYVNAYTVGDVPYGGASSTMTAYGGAFYASWVGSGGKHVEGVIRLSNVQNSVSYTDAQDNSLLFHYRTWITALGIRWYDTRFAAKNFFWEPQIGFSIGYIKPNNISGGGVSYSPADRLVAAGRIGIMAGKTYRLGSRIGLAYGRVDVQQELGGPVEGTGREESSGETVSVRMGQKNATWYDVTIGTSVALGNGKNNVVWGELTRRLGSNMKQTWNLTGGLIVRWGGAGRQEREEFERLKKDRHSISFDQPKSKFQSSSQQRN